MKKVVLTTLIIIFFGYIFYIFYKSITKVSLKPKLATTSITSDLIKRSNLNVITTSQNGDIINGTSNVGLNYLNIEGNGLTDSQNTTEINNVDINNTLNVSSNSIITNFNTKKQVIKGNQSVANSQQINQQTITTQNVGENSNINSININQNGTFNLLPKGVIIMWGNSTVPPGWAICNGLNETPDLRDRFIVSIGSKYNWKDTGGQKEVRLTVDELPSHSHEGHDHNCVEIALGQQDQRHFANCKSEKNTEPSGGNSDGSTSPHNNIPPYYALYYIMKL